MTEVFTPDIYGAHWFIMRLGADNPQQITNYQNNNYYHFKFFRRWSIATISFKKLNQRG